MNYFKMLLLFLFISKFSHSQEFNGIKIGDSPQEFISAMKAKGYVIDGGYDSETKTITFSGQVGDTRAKLIAVITPTSKKVWKLAIFMGKQTSWYALKSQYEKYLQVFTEKYGVPEKTYNFFVSPYKEGDGFEMSAISLDKCDYLAYWKDSLYLIEISNTKEVEISYENPENSKLNKSEKDELNKKVF